VKTFEALAKFHAAGWMDDGLKTEANHHLLGYPTDMGMASIGIEHEEEWRKAKKLIDT
jgi:hypothetical protein